MPNVIRKHSVRRLQRERQSHISDWERTLGWTYARRIRAAWSWSEGKRIGLRPDLIPDMISRAAASNRWGLMPNTVSLPLEWRGDLSRSIETTQVRSMIRTICVMTCKRRHRDRRAERLLLELPMPWPESILDWVFQWNLIIDLRRV